MTGTDSSKLQCCWPVLEHLYFNTVIHQLDPLLNLYSIKGQQQIQDANETELNFG